MYRKGDGDGIVVGVRILGRRCPRRRIRLLATIPA